MSQFFVYGTLKTGGKWHHLLQLSSFICKAQIKGDMRAGDFFPYLFEGNSKVFGEVYNIVNNEIDLIIELEGSAGYEIKKVKTLCNKIVTVFICNDISKRDSMKQIHNFDAKSSFNNWKKTTLENSDSYKEWLTFGKA